MEVGSRCSAMAVCNKQKAAGNSKGQPSCDQYKTNTKSPCNIPRVILSTPEQICDDGNLTTDVVSEMDLSNETAVKVSRKTGEPEVTKETVSKEESGYNKVRECPAGNPIFYLNQRTSADSANNKDASLNSQASSRSNSIQDPLAPLGNGSLKSVSPRSSAGSDVITCSLSTGDLPGDVNDAAKIGRKGKISTLSKGSQWSKLRNVIKASGAVNQEFKKRKMNSGLHRDDSFLRKFSTRNYRTRSVGSTAESDEGRGSVTQQMYMYPEEMIKESTVVKVTVIRPEGSIMFYWLAIVTLAVLYNLWTCIAREAFPEIVTGRITMWILMDVICDIIYVFDIGVQFRTGYLEQGLMVYSSKKLYKRYVHSQYFIIDVVSIIPLDFLQFAIGLHPMLRFPRFLKAHRLYSFIYKLESRTQYPNLFRVTNLTHILFLGAHWFAAFYFMISKAEGFHGQWSYPKPEGEFASATRKYLMSLYWSTLTLTTIGDLPEPNTTWEYVFVIVSYLIGVFVFATIVGQVGNVITNRNASRHDFERLLDGAKSYMRRHNVPKDMRKRVLRWYDYVWSRGRMDGSWDINSLGLLPDKLKTELAIHVNLETLKKVTIFQECQPEFLHDLVLKMKAYIFTPGDLICRHGEIAREMFIIADGVVEVISESGTVMTRMSTGDFFGEIGILNLDEGINRRSADVRSVGYSELFVLSRDDVLSALKDHPEAEKLLKDYGRQRLSVVRRLANLDAENARPRLITIRSNSTPSLPAPMVANPSPVTDLLSIHVPSRGYVTKMLSNPSTCSLWSLDPVLECQLIESLEGYSNGSNAKAKTVIFEDDMTPTRQSSPRLRRRSRSYSTCSPLDLKGLMKVTTTPKHVPDIVVEPASPEKPPPSPTASPSPFTPCPPSPHPTSPRTPSPRSTTGILVVDKAVTLLEKMFTEFWEETEKNYKETVRSLESENILKDMAITNLESKVNELQFEIAQLQCRIMAERRDDKPHLKTKDPPVRQRSLPEKNVSPYSESTEQSNANIVGEKKGTAV